MRPFLFYFGDIVVIFRPTEATLCLTESTFRSTVATLALTRSTFYPNGATNQLPPNFKNTPITMKANKLKKTYLCTKTERSEKVHQAFVFFCDVVETFTVNVATFRPIEATLTLNVANNQ
ncbi:hypothetical protein [Paenisporosarcina antarctica]|nr:hypothetical protein [Paenisporosarcina antarctica]